MFHKTPNKTLILHFPFQFWRPMKPKTVVPVFQNLQAPASSSSSASSDSSPSSASNGFDFDRDETYLDNIELDASLIKSSSAASTAGFSHSVRINYSLSRSNLQLLNSKLKLILSVLYIINTL